MVKHTITVFSILSFLLNTAFLDKSEKAYVSMIFD